MKQDHQIAGPSSYLRISLAGFVVATFVCVAPQVGHSVIKSPPEAAKATGPLSLAARPAPMPADMAEAAPSVEVVLSHADLQRWAAVGPAPLALPISFGRPVAPEDEAPPLPPRWHHKHVAHRTGTLRATATYPAPASADMAELEPSDLGRATAQGDDDTAP